MKQQTKLTQLANSPEVLSVAQTISKGLQWLKASPVADDLGNPLAAHYVTGGVHTLGLVAAVLIDKHVVLTKNSPLKLKGDVLEQVVLDTVAALKLRDFPTTGRLAHLIAKFVS